MNTINAPPGSPIERYSHPKLAADWLTREGSGKFPFIHQVEIAVAETLAHLGMIDEESASAVRDSEFDIQKILDMGGHDINAYLTVVRESMPEGTRGDLHKGLTSFDVQDTALVLMLVRAARVIWDDLESLRQVLLKLAGQHKDTLLIGRTHGVHAKPITFAFKVLVWVGFVERAQQRLQEAAKDIAVGKISGAVGVYTLPPTVEELVCKNLGLTPVKISTQILSRDLHADFFHAITCVAAMCEYIATEVRNHQRSEIGELAEPFPRGMKGSSAMPHKRNPEKCEQLCGLARTIRNDMGTIYENVLTWHERSIEQSSAERLVHAEMIVLAGYMVRTLTWVVEGLEVFPERMLANMEITRGAIYSEAIQLLLRERGVDPETAYRAVQEATQNAMNGEGHTKINILADPRVQSKLTAEDLDRIMNPWAELQHVGEIYKRFGI